MRRVAWGLFLLAATFAAWPRGDGGAGAEPSASVLAFPSEFEGEALVEEPLTERETAFATGFPGRIGRFTAGGKVVILRATDRATHRVHSAATCLAASGWKVEPLPVERRDSGVWSRFRAKRGGETLVVREQVRAADGTTIPDVPGWFWAVLLGRSRGPWLVVTVVARESLL